MEELRGYGIPEHTERPKAPADNPADTVELMADAGPIVGDLAAESDALDALVASLPQPRWRELTPADGWTIAHQIGHLLWTDRGSLTSITDEAAFADLLITAAADPTGFVNAAAQGGAARA